MQRCAENETKFSRTQVFSKFRHNKTSKIRCLEGWNEFKVQDIKLLDCTLRDGGYLNDWKFGKKNIVSITERLIDAEVDIIEVGFLDERRPADEERTIFPNTAAIDKAFGGIDKKNSLFVAMIDYGTCDIKNLSRCEDSVLDGIRVIFKKGKMKPAMEFCKAVKELGYKVFSQLVSITSYESEDITAIADLVNEVRPYCVSMVDTYGLMNGTELLRYYKSLDVLVDKEIRIGFHAHNNLQLGYANAMTFLDNRYRNLIVDGTLFGMGKSAGNDPIELVAMTLNEKYGGQYNIDSMLEAINESVMDFYSETPWGYSSFFYLCAKNRCHPSYLVDYHKRQNLSITLTDEVLGRIEPTDKKLLYDKSIGQLVYDNFTREFCNEKDADRRFGTYVDGRKVLIVGPGKNIALQADKVKEFAEKNDPLIISINYIPENISPDCVFITNPKRYHDMTLTLKKDIKTLATTNVSCRNGEFDFVVNRVPLLQEDVTVLDNSFLMLIKFLRKIGIKEVYCAGFDGYSDKESNYVSPEMEYNFVRIEAKNLNNGVRNMLNEYEKTMDIHFITYSAYEHLDEII